MKKQFRLVRYFTVASIGMFAAVAAALAYFEHQQASFMAVVQRKDRPAAAGAGGLLAAQGRVAREDLLPGRNAPTSTSRACSSTRCGSRRWRPSWRVSPPFRWTIAGPSRTRLPADGPAELSAAKKACFAEVGARLRALPEFQALDARVAEATRKSSVFKIKAFDLGASPGIPPSTHRWARTRAATPAGAGRCRRPRSELTTATGSVLSRAWSRTGT